MTLTHAISILVSVDDPNNASIPKPMCSIRCESPSGSVLYLETISLNVHSRLRLNDAAISTLRAMVDDAFTALYENLKKSP